MDSAPSLGGEDVLLCVPYVLTFHFIASVTRRSTGSCGVTTGRRPRPVQLDSASQGFAKTSWVNRSMIVFLMGARGSKQ